MRTYPRAVHPGNLATPGTVSLDGQDISDTCALVDLVHGWARCYVRSESGGLVVSDDGRLQTRVEHAQFAITVCDARGATYRWSRWCPWSLRAAWWWLESLPNTLRNWARFNALPAARYLRVLVAHKWFVWRAGRRLKVPAWRLLIHDWSKLRRSELFAYGRRFCLSGYVDFDRLFGGSDFKVAWLYHTRRNPHHWEYWVPAEGDPLPMPEVFVREMVADWLAASRAYEGEWPESRKSWPWLARRLPEIEPQMHPGTRRRVDELLEEYFDGGGA